MPGMIIRTKIIVTVGPASGSAETLGQLARAGADVFRINFSHGDAAQHGQFLRNVRAVEAELGEPLAVMGDLCGPKIRVGPIRGGSMLLGDGHRLVIQREAIEGVPGRISTTLGELVDAVEAGQGVLLDDGRIRLVVREVCPPDEVVCEVVRGGVLSSGKGVNLPHTSMALAALTEKDRRDAAWLAERDFDYVALSFVRTAADVAALRALLDAAGCDARIVAKIEKPQALEHIEEIVGAADAVMVARGDLGVEMALPSVPVTQKRIARLCRTMGQCCIVATQMLETMTHSPTPTRAEVSDVANAVLDGADAVMLSGETAVGEFPVAAVRMMDSIVREVESYADETADRVRVSYAAARTAAALAAAVREVLAVEDVAAVAVYTATGTTARMLAKSRLPCPILGMAPDRAVARRMCLYYGVAAHQADAPEHTRDVLALAEAFARRHGIAESGDKLGGGSGRPLGKPGSTNTLVVHTVR
jgi:pyruvate kinase